jgi:hypothetical protein
MSEGEFRIEDDNYIFRGISTLRSFDIRTRLMMSLLMLYIPEIMRYCEHLSEDEIQYIGGGPIDWRDTDEALQWFDDNGIERFTAHIRQEIAQLHSDVY